MTSDAQRLSRKQEDRTAARFNGSRNAMSGAGWMRKADVRAMRFLIENKLRIDLNAKSYSAQAIELRDLTKRARSEGRIPLLQFDLGGHNYVILPEDDFLELLEEAEGKQ